MTSPSNLKTVTWSSPSKLNKFLCPAALPSFSFEPALAGPDELPLVNVAPTIASYVNVPPTGDPN